MNVPSVYIFSLFIHAIAEIIFLIMLVLNISCLELNTAVLQRLQASKKSQHSNHQELSRNLDAMPDPPKLSLPKFCILKIIPVPVKCDYYCFRNQLKCYKQNILGSLYFLINEATDSLHPACPQSLFQGLSLLLKTHHSFHF